eukprot:1312052-Pleurochrysis_carterae.AAC.1
MECVCVLAHVLRICACRNSRLNASEDEETDPSSRYRYARLRTGRYDLWNSIVSTFGSRS